ncbi:hypothetical protein [Streptomyces milbemycinicus]|uniref:hypothetical protein n=1 Tax=Streptomyces milbemycinicus TaxID=476552 RepID=UPI0033E7C1E4
MSGPRQAPMRSGPGGRTTPPTGHRPATWPRHPATRTARRPGRPAARREAPVIALHAASPGAAATLTRPRRARTGRGVPAARTAPPWRETGGRAAW